MNAATIERRMPAPPHAVWSVLADGWAYAGWVVGASRIREVDPTWPSPEARIHHSVGLWPLLLDDSTSVLSCEPERQLVLKARAWPTGEAHVELSLEADGDGDGCIVRMTEDAVAGPAQLVPRPARQGLIIPRNHEALRRLEYLALGRLQDAR